MSEQKSAFAGWAILELMGHRRLGGYLTEQEIAGAAFLRIDVPGKAAEPVATQFYSASAVYCITPTTEEMARAVAVANQPEPVHRWELPALTESKRGRNDADDEADDVQRCRVCGCTDERACPGGCCWVEDDLCSACVGKEAK